MPILVQPEFIRFGGDNSSEISFGTPAELIEGCEVVLPFLAGGGGGDGQQEEEEEADA